MFRKEKRKKTQVSGGTRPVMGDDLFNQLQAKEVRRGLARKRGAGTGAKKARFNWRKALKYAALGVAAAAVAVGVIVATVATMGVPLVAAALIGTVSGLAVYAGGSYAIGSTDRKRAAAHAATQDTRLEIQEKINEGLSKKLSDAQAQIDNPDPELGQLKEELKQATEHQAGIEAELSTAQLERNQFRKSLHAENGWHDRTREERDAALAQLAEHRTEIHKLRGEKREIQNVNIALNDDLAHSQQQGQTLARLLSERSRALDEMTARNSTQVAVSEEQKTAITDLREQLHSSSQINQKLRVAVGVLERKISGLSAQHETLTESHSILKGEKESLQARLTEGQGLNEELNEANQAVIDELEQVVSRLTGELGELRQLHAQYEQVQSEFNTLQNAHHHLQEDYHDQASNLGLVTREHNELKTHTNELSSKFDQENKVLEQEIRQKSKALLAAKNKVSELSGSLEHSESELETLGVDHAQLTKDHSRLQSTSKDYQLKAERTLSDLQADQADLFADNQRVSNSRSNLEKELQLMQERLHAQEAEIKALKSPDVNHNRPETTERTTLGGSESRRTLPKVPPLEKAFSTIKQAQKEHQKYRQALQIAQYEYEQLKAQFRELKAQNIKLDPSGGRSKQLLEAMSSTEIAITEKDKAIKALRLKVVTLEEKLAQVGLKWQSSFKPSHTFQSPVLQAQINENIQEGTLKTLFEQGDREPAVFYRQFALAGYQVAARYGTEKREKGQVNYSVENKQGTVALPFAFITKQGRPVFLELAPKSNQFYADFIADIRAKVADGFKMLDSLEGQSEMQMYRLSSYATGGQRDWIEVKESTQVYDPVDFRATDDGYRHAKAAPPSVLASIQQDAFASTMSKDLDRIFQPTHRPNTRPRQK